MSYLGSGSLDDYTLDGDLESNLKPPELLELLELIPALFFECGKGFLCAILWLVRLRGSFRDSRDPRDIKMSVHSL